MESINVIFQPFWQILAYLCFAFVAAMGVVALMAPKFFTVLSAGSNIWFDTSKVSRVVERKFDLDEFAMRHCRIYGATMLFVSVAMCILPAVEVTWPPFAFACASVAGFMGLLAVATPAWFIKLTRLANTWVDTSKITDFIDRPRDFDAKIIKNCRVFGVVLLLGAIFAAIAR